MAKSTGEVALVCTSDHKEGVKKAVRLLKANPVKGKTVLLKPNFNTADPFPASTHNDTLHTLISVLKEMGAIRIILAERSGPSKTQEAMEQKGIFEMSNELGFEIVNLDEIRPEEWVHLKPQNSHWENGFKFARTYAEADCIVQTCCLKTHNFGGHFTMSLKNSVGMVERSFMRELHSSQYQRQMIAEINTAYSPDLIVMDGIKAFVGGGPMHGVEADANMIASGNDRIAIDATGVAMLRLLGATPAVTHGAVLEQDQLARAVELGLGIKSPDDINFITDDNESAVLAKKLKAILLEGA
jgi:uncharacterized protein (DUF362 family)